MNAKMARGVWMLVAIVSLNGHVANGQSRDEKVLQDRQNLANDTSWHYDNLEQGISAAIATKKPLMVVLRCIP